MTAVIHARASWRSTVAPLVHAANPKWRAVARPGRQTARCFANAENGKVAVSFHLPYHCKFGQQLCLIGGSDDLGSWAVERAVPMTWTDGDVWVAELQLPAHGDATIEYKYVVRHERDKTPVRWKEGGNFYLHLPAHGRLRVLDTWDESSREVEVVTPPAEGEAAPPPAQAAAAEAPLPPPAAQAPPPPPPAAPAPAPQRRQRRRKPEDEDAEAMAVISRAAVRATKQLDEAVARSLDLLGATSDPAAPELLAADRMLAAAAKQATTMTKALEAAQEAKLLAAPTAAPAEGKPSTTTRTRRRRKPGSKDGSAA